MKSLLTTLILCISLIGFSAPTDSVGYFFEFDLKYEGASTAIDNNYRYALEKLIQTLEEKPELLVHVRGHVCCGPGEKISRRRARKVRRFLIRQGIDKSRITYRGYSNEAPLISPEKTEDDERRNRRVDFILYHY